MTLANHLNTLESAGLIRLAAAQPELEYLFRHVLIQDAAYSSLVKQDRKQLHRSVGETLERMHPDRVDELAPVLGRHFDEAGDGQRALKYFTLAGDEAASRYANAEAVAYYTRALEAARRSAAALERLVHLYTHRGRALELSGRYEEALENYHEMETLARERGSRSMELAALMARATLRSTPTLVYDPARGQALAEQALTLARELSDRQAQSKILWNLMLLHSFLGHPNKVVEYGEQSLAIARELGLREQLAYTLNDIFRGYMALGRFERARVVLDESRDLWRESNNLPMLADNYGRFARLQFAVGEYEQAVASAEEARRLSLSIGNVWGQSFCRMFVGYVYLERREPGRAIEIMEECIELGEQAGFTMAQVGTRADLAWVYGTLGAIERGLELARLARATAEQRLPGFRPWALASLARLHVMNDDLAAAKAALEEGYAVLGQEDFTTHAPIEIPLADAELALATDDGTRAMSVMDDLLARLRKVGIRPFAADALYLKGRALLSQGEMDAGWAILMDARAEAEALGSRRMLLPILMALGQIEARRGNRAEAESLRRRAGEIGEYIAAHCPAELRASFLALPHLREVSS